MTNFEIAGNVSSMKCALILVPDLADVGVPRGIRDGPRTQPGCMEGVLREFQMTNFDIPTNVPFKK